MAMLPTAALLFGGGYVLVGWAEQRVPSGPAALLNATTPAWVVLDEWFAGRRKRPRVRFAATLGLGIGGVAVLVGGGQGTSIPLVPALALVGSSIAWAAGIGRTRQHSHGDPVRDAALQMLTGGLLLVPFSALGEGARVLDGFTTESYVNPLIAVLVGAALAHERLTIATGIAATLILMSVFSIVRERAIPVRSRESARRSPRPRIAA